MSDAQIFRFSVMYGLSSLPGHIDTQCYGSGTSHVARAHINSIGKPMRREVNPAQAQSLQSRAAPLPLQASPPSQVPKGYVHPILNGAYCQEAHCLRRDEHGLLQVDWAKADDIATRGAGSADNLLAEAIASARTGVGRTIVMLFMGRKSTAPGNEIHFVLGMGKGSTGWTMPSKRARIVDYMTASHGGMAVMLAKVQPKVFEGVVNLAKPGVLPPLTADQETWSKRVRLFDNEDDTRQFILTSLFYKWIVERHVEEVDMYQGGKCDLSAKRIKRLFGPHESSKEGEAIHSSEDEDEDWDEDVVTDDDNMVQARAPHSKCEDMACLAELQALSKYEATLLLALREWDGALVVDGIDIVRYQCVHASCTCAHAHTSCVCVCAHTHTHYDPSPLHLMWISN